VGEAGAAADTRRMSPQAAEHHPHQSAAEVLLTASQLVERFAVSRAWVYQAAANDRLPYRRLGTDGPVRFVSSEIDAWLDEQRRGWSPVRRP
jgi:predicted DNA-binding transcriptional regulator AlpA